MGRSFRIEGAALMLAALAVLIAPLNWVLAAAVAAAIHEGSHYLAARMLGIRIYGISVGLGGCRMDTAAMDRKQELICAAAGPVGSLSLLFLLRWFPRLAICGAVQGIYNLLPMGTMDGGRILRCMAGERVCDMVSCMAVVSLILLGTAAWIRWDLGPIPLLFGLITAGKCRKLKNSLQTGSSRSTIELPFFKR